MRSNRKILDNNQINWQNDGNARLSYQMIFDDRPPVAEREEKENTPDVGELLKENDRKWQEKLQKARREVFEVGLKEGRQQGLEQARAEFDQKLADLKQVFREAHQDWKETQKLLEPGLLDMTFNLSEAILGIPVENPAIREKMEKELGPLLQKVDEQSKPVLWISEEDSEYIEKIKQDYSPQTPVNTRIDRDFNPGEFKLESSRETVVHQFKTLLSDLKDSLSLPSWKR